jgi:hypothetical protein
LGPGSGDIQAYFQWDEAATGSFGGSLLCSILFRIHSPHFNGSSGLSEHKRQCLHGTDIGGDEVIT